jgi:hypothetical protein
MQVKPSELEKNGNKLQDELGHREVIEFVRKYIKKRTVSSVLYTVINVLIAVCILVLYWLDRNSDIRFMEGVVYLSYGFAIAFLLIPIHEYIHVLACKSQGAKNTSYDDNLKKFYFMAIADQFVANRKEFKIVALALFVVVSIISCVLLFVSNEY